MMRMRLVWAVVFPCYVCDFARYELAIVICTAARGPPESMLLGMKVE